MGRFCRSGPRATGQRAFGCVKREPIATGGNRATAPNGVEVGETGSDKAPGVASQHDGGQRQGSRWPREGGAIPARGKL